jgi:CubicO group peptidase (beta-lactamase class C family)
MQQKLTRLRGAVALAAFIVLPCAQAATSRSAFEAQWRSVVTRFQQRLTDEQVVGASIAFTSKQHGRHAAYFGVQDLETKAPVDENTLFHWASITKTFTAIAAMQLVERGKLDLDAPAIYYLPELRPIHSPNATIDSLHVVHLMTHTSGLRNPTWPWGGDKPWHPHEPTEWSQLVAMMPYTELEFAPGARYSYSNPGYTFLGRIVEVLSGENIETYIEKNVLRPLAMHASYFDLTPAHLLTHRSNNYYLVDGKPVANGADFDTGVTTGNGGLNASVADMLRYIEFLSGREPDARFPLPRGSLERMWLPRAEVHSEPGLKEAIGYGFFIIDVDAGDKGAPPQRFIGHTGTQMGFRSAIYVDPQRHEAALIVLNTRATENSRQLNIDTRRDLFSMLFSSRAGAGRPARSRR